MLVSERGREGKKRKKEGREGRRKERRERGRITGREGGGREATLTWLESRWILASYCSQQPELT